MTDKVFALTWKHIDDRYLDHCIATWLLTHRGAGHIDQYLTCEGRVVDTHVKLQTLVLNNQIQFMSFIGMGSIFTMVLVVFAEFLCSLFVILGLFTRIACIPLMFTMLVAFFVVHGSDAYADKELSILYFFIYLIILVLGSGKFSVDALMTKKAEAY